MTEIDEYGDLEAWRQEHKTKLNRHEFLKKKLAKDLTAGVHSGEQWLVYITPKVWTGLDQQAMKDANAYDQWITSKPYNEVTVQRKDNES